MGFLSGMTEAGASALSAGLGFIGNLGGSVAGGLFSANQARKNRKFQERMYNKQVEDSINFWKMQQEYNLPSAQLQRIKDAGLSPLLAYGEGGLSGNIAGQPPASATAPHGAQGNVSSFNTRIDLANLALVQAQGEALRAEAAEKRQSAKESEERTYGQALQNEITFRTRDAMVAIKHKDVDFLNQQIEWLATQDFALTEMTAANLHNLSSIMEYRQKYYDLDYDRTINQMWYNIEQIALGKMHVSNELKELSIKMYEAETNRKRVDGELKVFMAQVAEINSRTDLTNAQKDNEILKAFHQSQINSFFDYTGSESTGSLGGLILLLSGKMFGREPEVTY